jgi:SP family general alpha glucoside:H+ symporter-like MFS transporter
VNLCWVLGQFLASGVLKAMLLRDDKWGYKIPFALQWMWPIPLAIGIWLAPESPWWLVRRGRLEDAKASLIRLTDRNTEVSFNPDETVSMMIHTNEMEKELVAGTSYRDLFRGANLRRTEIVSVVWCVQALCGSGLIGYSTIFYQQAGMAVENSFTMSLAQYAIMGIGTVLSWVLIGRVGRRTLYLYGQMALFLLLIVMGSVAFAGRENVAAQWTIGSLLLVFTLIYGCTVGPACYCLVAELSSTRLRRKSVAVARNAYNIASCFTNAVTPRMVNPSALNWGGKTALFFAGTCLCCIAWTYFRLPEPKGRTYAELDVLFEQRVSARKFSSTVIDRLDSQVAPAKSSMEKETETVMIERAKTAGAE